MNTIIKRTWNQNRMVNIEALTGAAFQAEDGGHTFEISGINEANEAVSLSGTVTGVFMRPDGTDVALTGTASDGVVSVTLSDACYAVAGRFGLTIFVTADSKKTCVYACIGTVAQTSYGTVAGDTPQDVVDLINAINAAIASIPADYTDLMAAIAPTYSDQSVYPAGAYRWYNGILYKSKVAITTAESFTAAHWETVALADDVSELKSEINLTGFLNFNNNHYYQTPSIGGIVNNPPTANATNLVDGIAIECVRGQAFVLYGTPYNNSGIRPCCFTDENRYVRYKLDTTEVLDGYVVIAPFDGWALFNFRNSAPHYVYTSDSVVSKSLEQRFNTIESIPQHYGYIQLKKNQVVSTPAIGETFTPAYVDSSNMSVSSVYMTCVKGQKFILNGKPTGSTSFAPYLFADENNTVVYREQAVADAPVYVNKVIEAPVDGILVVNLHHKYTTEVFDCFVYTPSADVSALLNYGVGDVVTEITEDIPSTNIFDGDVTRGHYLNNSGTIGNASNLCYTNTYYPVSENDKFIAGTGEDTKAQLRYVTAYDADKNVLSTKGLNGGYTYTTPEGVSFVRFTFYIADVDSGTFRLNKSAFLKPYESHDDIVVPKGYEDTVNILNKPLSTLPDYIINSLAYKPLGALSKPYICLVSDDGDEDMITYSIPMVESKGVPATWAIMSTSEMFRTANVETNVATVLDSVNNHGCAIAQHGGINWTEYTEADLNEFFEREKTFMASYGLTAKSAVIPSHYTSPLVCAVAGGKYGVCRSGLNGLDAHGNTYEELMKPYPHYTCGARTNVYCLSSQNIANITQADARTVIDYVNANNGIAIFYWHENALDSAKKQRIEDAIDYAIGLGIDFITLDQIKTII